MGFVITYKPLFEVRLLHHYHLDRGGAGGDYQLFDLATAAEQEAMLRRYNMAAFLDIEPTPACAALLKKHQCIFRRQEDRLIIAVKVTLDTVLNKYKPLVPLGDDLAFHFRYRAIDNHFLNYTNLPLQRDRNTIYFFCNRKEGSARTYPALTKAAPVRDNLKIYSAGEILLTADLATVLIAGRITGPLNTPSQSFTSDPKVNGNALAYVNRNDLIRTSGNGLTVDTGLQGRRENVTVSVTDGSGTLITPKVVLIEDGNTIAQVDFTPFAEGVYTVHLEDAGSAYTEDVTFYLHKGSNNSDGIIQINVKSDDASFNLLNANGTIKEGNQMKSFLVRFKNRETIWRYLGDNFDNMPESGPHLLARDGFVNLSINDENAAVINDPPNASVHMIKTEKPVAAPEYYNLISEIYINS
jgi:hypothetical protein